jgi:phosphopantetheinyl transferase
MISLCRSGKTDASRQIAMLTPEETQRATALKHEGRRWHYIAGRAAAKGVLGTLMGKTGMPFWRSVAVRADRYGMPYAVERVSARPIPFSLSIAHSGSFAIAAVNTKGIPHRIGIDVEVLSGNHAGLEAGGFVPSEMEMIPPGSNRGQWLLRLWCVKEAVAKLTGKGLMGDPHSVRIRHLVPLSGTVTATLAGPLIDQWPSMRDVAISVMTEVDTSRDLVVACTVW